MQSKEYKLPNGKTTVFEYDVYKIGKVTLESMDELMSMIADRPQGEWINKHKWDNGFLERECSLCGAMKPILMHTAKINYCPNCGARMKGADDEGHN